MEKRTAEIIMVCKGQHDFGKFPTLKQAVIAYMSDRCCCPVEEYTDKNLRGIIYDAFMDYMFSCANSREFLYHIKEALYWCDWSPREGMDDITAVLIGFQLCNIRDDTGYINGFSDENTQRVCRKADRPVPPVLQED